jgi:hypothetical protein
MTWFDFAVLMAVLSAVSLGALTTLALGYSAGRLYGWWKDRVMFLKWTRLQSLLGTGPYQWETVRQAIVEKGMPEFSRAKAKGEPDLAALTLAMVEIHNVLARRSRWWQAFRRKNPQVLDPTRVIGDIETELTRLRVENASFRRDLVTLRQQNHQGLIEMQEIEDIALYLASEQAAAKGQEHLPFYGADLDAVRTRMGRAPKTKPVSVDDLLIDASLTIKWIESLRTSRAIEPPPAFFQLKQHIAAIPARKAP